MERRSWQMMEEIERGVLVLEIRFQMCSVLCGHPTSASVRLCSMFGFSTSPFPSQSSVSYGSYIYIAIVYILLHYT